MHAPSLPRWGWRAQRLRPGEGYAVDYRLDVYEDPPAARGEARILDYLEDMRGSVRRPQDALGHVLA
ncbi:MAG: hypothetical protein HUU30_02590, partial [Burkholderiaceae bacterium]|nr:hypothetical protein [Burkholderiaceae bacterium]